MTIEPFNWHCEYCGQNTTITHPNCSNTWTNISTKNSKFNRIGLLIAAITCPNQDCKELTLKVSLHNAEYSPRTGGFELEGDALKYFKLMPRSKAKPQPEYIPQEIRSNYQEACLILNDSPKASAAMSRRCLQGIVRDFWEIPSNKRGNLGAEINFIKDKLNPDDWEAINAVRSVGDIGAHMEKDVNTIIDVESEEADLLIQLIETFFQDWYVAKHKRQNRNKRLINVAADKLQQKKDIKKAHKDLKATETPIEESIGTGRA